MSLSFQAQIALCRRAAIKYTRSASGAARKQATVLEAMPAPGNPFHLAIPVHSIPAARKFYGGILGLKEGRRAVIRSILKFEVTVDDQTILNVNDGDSVTFNIPEDIEEYSFYIKF